MKDAIKTQDIINEILDNFDYKTMRKCMKKLKWTWYDSDEVPTVERIRSQAQSLLEHALASPKKNYTTGTGGLEVYKMNGYISLVFAASAYEVAYE